MLKNRLEYFWFFILFFIVVAPSFKLIPALSYYDAKRTLQISILILLYAYFLLYRNDFRELYKLFSNLDTRFKFSIIAFILCGIISASFAKYSLYAFTEIWLFVSLIILTFTTAYLHLQLKNRFLTSILLAITLLAGLYSINFIISYLSTLILGFGEFWPSQNKISGREFLGFSYVRFFNQVQTLTIFILLLPYFYLSDEKWVWRKISLVLGSLWFMFIFTSGARGTLIAIIFAITFVSILFPKKAMKWVKVCIYVSLVGFILNFILFEFGTGETLQKLSRTNTSGRLIMWSMAYEWFLHNPVFGIGPMQLADYELGISHAHPHNGYLQILAEWGLPAFLLAAYVAINGFLKFKNLGSELDTSKKEFHVYIALLLTITAAAVHTFVSGVIVMPLSQMIFAIILGWALGFYLKHQTLMSKPNIQNITLIKGLRLLFVIPIVGLLFTLINDIPYLDSKKREYPGITGETTFKPRIWQQGKILKGLSESKNNTLILNGDCIYERGSRE